MSESSGLTAGDVMALTRRDDNIFGDGWMGIIGLLIIAGIFGNGGFFGNNNNNSVSDEFVKRDIFNTNSNVLAQGNVNQVETLNAKYDNAVNTLSSANATQKDILENRYANELGFANAQKDTLLGQANINQNILLGNQNMLSQMAQCCCDMKTTIHSEGEATRALITENRIQDLQYQLGQANTAVANAVQTQNILNSLGNYYPRAGVNPYNIYTYGTTIA